METVKIHMRIAHTVANAVRGMITEHLMLEPMSKTYVNNVKKKNVKNVYEFTGLT